MAINDQGRCRPNPFCPLPVWLPPFPAPFIQIAQATRLPTARAASPSNHLQAGLRNYHLVTIAPRGYLLNDAPRHLLMIPTQRRALAERLQRRALQPGRCHADLRFSCISSGNDTVDSHHTLPGTPVCLVSHIFIGGSFRRASADLSIFPADRLAACPLPGWLCPAAENPLPRHRPLAARLPMGKPAISPAARGHALHLPGQPVCSPPPHDQIRNLSHYT
jgi:hypothetical protein